MTIRPELSTTHSVPQLMSDESQPESAPNGTHTIVIEPMHGWAALDLSEVWRYRELLYFLTWRDVKVRYKQTTIGATWAVLQPFLMMVVFSLIFGHLAGLSSDGAPYPVFSYVALLPWTFFSTAINRSGVSLVYDANLISKVYFPRIIVPIAAVLAITADLVVAFALLLGLMLFYGVIPGIGVLSLPFFTLLALLSALGVGFWLAALNVKYRDVTHVLPFLTYLWLFVTPVAYSTSMIPEQWRLLYGLNPMAGVIEGFRWALLNQGRTPEALIIVSVVVSLSLLVSGLFYFRRMECEFADVV